MPSKATQAQAWPVWKPRGWGEPSTRTRPLPRPYYGLDTERDSKTGEFVCGWAVREDGKAYRFRSLEDLKPGTHWVWNLAYDVEGLLRDTGVVEAWCAKIDAAEFMFKDGPAKYYHGKRFEWKRPKGTVLCLEASSFWGRIPLSKLGAKEGVDASRMSLERYEADPEYRRAVDSYCRQDSRIVVENILNLERGVQDIGAPLAATPGGTARGFLSRVGSYPSVVWETHKDFLRSYAGGRFEIVKRGVFMQDVYQYDITSAYPAALAECPWLTASAYTRGVREVHDDALYGSYEVSFVTDEYLGLAPVWRGSTRVYSNAQGRTWLSKPEVEWLQDNGYNFTIHRGTEIYDDASEDRWGPVVRELFNMKQEFKGEPKGMGAKIVINSLYGILIQLIRRPGEWKPIREVADPVDVYGTLGLEAPPEEFEAGKFYAPVYASTLTAMVRVQLLDAARQAGEEYIGGHTDSVLSMKPLDLPEGLGGWELEQVAKRGDVSKTGMYCMDDKVKMRGVTRDGDRETLWQPRHVRRQRIGIKQAKSFEDVSLIIDKEVENSLLTESKRRWDRELTLDVVERGEWIDSEAWSHV